MHILMIHTREICYFSGAFFLHRMEDALERVGAEVTFLELSSENADWNQLEDLLWDKDSYDAILDINSKLPYLTTDSEEPFLDQLGIPFFNWIVDHPLYHHPGLFFPLHNYHALCIDKSHERYTRMHYPHLQTVSYLPLPGCPSVNEMNKTFDGILLPATYVPTNVIREEWDAFTSGNRAKIRKLMEDLYEIYDPFGEPIEVTLEKYLAQEGREPEDYGVYDFAELLNYLYPLDRRVRYEYRMRYAKAAAETGVPLRILGEGWEDTEIARFRNVNLLPPVPIALTYDRIAESRAILDINPLFYEGVHDRVPSALLNKTLVFTNMSKKAEPGLSEETGVFYYRGTEGLKEQIEKVFYEEDGQWKSREEFQNVMDMERAKETCPRMVLTWDDAAKKFMERVRLVRRNS